ncbi:50S ribosomal protein L4 [Candidatus Saccharibacteria bacterium]|jgi:large subunit ribosomal protein L4|nr:50S ribosomal protein L4 [Candidatus Saccharibacteria bacterium]
MSVASFTKTGSKSTSKVDLPENVFAEDIQSHQLLKDTYVAYLSNGRTINAHVKTRGEVRGGGKKPWKQKGTGRARHGSIRSPIWRGGGITFGPTDDRNFTKKINKKAKQKALRQALTLAAEQNAIMVIEDFTVKEGKTKEIAGLLQKLDIDRGVLMVTDSFDEMLSRAARNIPFAQLKQVSYLNVYEVLNAHSIVFTKKALSSLEENLGVAK